MDKLSLWLTKQEPVRVVPIFDKIILFLVKIIYLLSYLTLRLSLRIALGKKRRDRVFDKKGLTFNYEFDAILSFYIIKFLYSIIKFLRLANPCLLKISVPKYGGYKAYCPINKNEFINMTIREDEIIEQFLPKQGDIVVDIGAHIGHYTLIASKRVGTNGKVVAIEAHPGNFEMLNRNIKLNQLANVISLNYAVYSKETKIKLYLPDEESGYTMHHSIMSDYIFTKYKDKTEDKFVETNANTLDYLLQLKGITDVNWVKIDVEGAEFEVLKGANKILSDSKDIALLIEVHGKNTYEPIIESLRSYNFKIDFEKTYENGEKHIIAIKDSSVLK